MKKATKANTALEAKASGQSFDEWVKGQGKPVYHGSPFKGLEDLNTGEFAYRGNTFTGKNYKVKPNAVYFSENPNVAKFFGENKASGLKELNVKTGTLKIEPTVYERYLKSKKTLDLTTIEKADKFLYDNGLMKEVENALGEGPIGEQGLLDMIEDSGADIKVSDLRNLTDNKPIVDTMKKLGYDVVKFKETGDIGISFAVLDKNILKTNSQLKAEWDRD
jgi:2',3'-cyclic-nucleotide 2'-phosphodiesterase (5'-nucleotidase family)